MLQLFPFLAWLAVGTSVVLLVFMWSADELGPRSRYLFAGWCLAAAWGQFFGTSVVVSTGGFVLQTVLAVYLLLRWRAGGP